MFPYRRLPNYITGLYVFTVANFMLLCHMTLVQGDISVLSLQTNETVYPNIPDMPAYFGSLIPTSGILGQVVYSNPPNACSAIDGPPTVSTINFPTLKWFVLIRRNDCSFSQKVLNAQRAGYDAAIIHNVNSDQLEPMGPSQGLFSDRSFDYEGTSMLIFFRLDKVITIPSVFIGETDGLVIKKLYTYDKGYFVVLMVDYPFGLSFYLIPFVVGVGACLFIVMLILVFKCLRDRRQRMRHRLPTRLLKKLPIKKFNKSDQYDVCAICLEDYKEGEKLRVLPCSHTYHTKCIDPWLTENRRNCPVCKRKVLFGVSSDHQGSSDSDSDEGGGGGSIPNENTPLLVNRSNASFGGVGNRGYTNSALMTEDGDYHEEGTATRRTNSVDTSDDERCQSKRTRSESCGMSSSSQSSTGCNYNSFATPTESPVLMATLATPTDSLLVVPSVMVSGDLMSSGEHSVNGEYVDFSPIDATRRSAGPVEIAIDVAARQQSISSPGPFGVSPSSSRSHTNGTKSQDMVV